MVCPLFRLLFRLFRPIPADADTGVVLFSATLSREKVAEVLRPLVGVG